MQTIFIAATNNVVVPSIKQIIFDACTYVLHAPLSYKRKSYYLENGKQLMYTHVKGN